LEVVGVLGHCSQEVGFAEAAFCQLIEGRLAALAFQVLCVSSMGEKGEGVVGV
jgi:hypothetical protein